jgi:hypothetical protein
MLLIDNQVDTMACARSPDISLVKRNADRHDGESTDAPPCVV